MLYLLSEIAFAQAAAAAKGPSFVETLVPFAFLIMLMYFFVLRPQAKKTRDLATLIQNLKKGDEVVTAGGLIGKVAGIADTFVTLDVSQNTSLKVIKSSITGLTDVGAANVAATTTAQKTK